MTNIEQEIARWLKDGDSRDVITRKLFLIVPTAVFVDRPNDQYRVYDQIARAFSVPIASIEVVGSAKTGVSLWKGHEFAQGQSDLDIGIVNGALYLAMFEAAFLASSGFADISMFASRFEHRRFLENLNRGILVPKQMPRCKEKTKWLGLFGQLSRENKHLFSGVTAYLYASEVFFEAKQAAAVDKFLAEKGIE
jgi:hypothetical protein